MIAKNHEIWTFEIFHPTTPNVVYTNYERCPLTHDQLLAYMSGMATVAKAMAPPTRDGSSPVVVARTAQGDAVMCMTVGSLSCPILTHDPMLSWDGGGE